MKKSELVELINVLVKEEVNRVLPQLLMEVLAEKITENTSSVTDASRRPTQPSPRAITSYPTVPPKTPQSQPKVYARDPVLNQILNETTGGIPAEEETPSVMDVVENLPPQVLNENTAVAAVAGAMNKDYRHFLKVVDSKRVTPPIGNPFK